MMGWMHVLMVARCLCEPRIITHHLMAPRCGGFVPAKCWRNIAICKIGVKMQEVFEELLEETRALRHDGFTHWYNQWYSYCDTGRWRKCSARIVRWPLSNPSWGVAYSMYVHQAPNFSHFVRHHQAQ